MSDEKKCEAKGKTVEVEVESKILEDFRKCEAEIVDTQYELTKKWVAQGERISTYKLEHKKANPKVRTIGYNRLAELFSASDKTLKAYVGLYKFDELKPYLESSEEFRKIKSFNKGELISLAYRDDRKEKLESGKYLSDEEEKAITDKREKSINALVEAKTGELSSPKEEELELLLNETDFKQGRIELVTNYRKLVERIKELDEMERKIFGEVDIQGEKIKELEKELAELKSQ